MELARKARSVTLLLGLTNPQRASHPAGHTCPAPLQSPRSPLTDFPLSSSHRRTFMSAIRVAVSSVKAVDAFLLKRTVARVAGSFNRERIVLDHAANAWIR
ncbi:hypothetical protein NDU88_004946 [Pleurodeles waltl]|uniref:Uncharacterized protein n=1 Tax=Pleurodeles waltl TaxID=8319 RepID=A0AAV7PFH4_PLEWA|nr:hypothetical protein NDU88_004946 [Pleurodeles waltl]